MLFLSGENYRNFHKDLQAQESYLEVEIWTRVWALRAERISCSYLVLALLTV